MIPNQNEQSGAMNVEHLQSSAINGVEFICSVVAMPVEMMAIRPWHGTRYFGLPVVFFSSLLMIALPIIGMVATSVQQMIPFTHFAPPRGMFGFADFAKLYFLMLLIHSVRLARRMLKPETEMHSEYEGPALPVFAVLPKGRSFWFTRIAWEPVFVFVASIVLSDLFIVQPGLCIYLRIAAFMLAIKEITGWYRSWEFVRKILDMRNAAPALARLVDDTATEEDLAPIHLASFPRNIAPDVRREAATHIARAFTAQTYTPDQAQGGHHDTDR
jgi:hypothetical protein